VKMKMKMKKSFFKQQKNRGIDVATDETGEDAGGCDKSVGVLVYGESLCRVLTQKGCE